MTAPHERLTADGSVTIYLFHGVIERQVHPVRNYTRKHLPVSDFDAIVGELARCGTPVSMDDVLAHCLSGAPFPKGAFAVTFDDGFENNLSVARPVLEKHRIPATVYVTSGFIERNGMSWIDRLELVIESADRGELSLPWASEPRAFSDAASKIAILDEMRRHVKHDPRIKVNEFVRDIYLQLGREAVDSSDDPLDLKMTWQQVADWCAPGYTIGGHSHTHPILSYLSSAALAEEIEKSLDLLREKAGIVTPHYSYPEGLAHCFSDTVIDELKSRGIKCCPTAIDGINPPGTDPFLLRRVMVS
jgi:peptidoglycan/xylan/chitin deacetylase (PgdA/CDA1 family)